MFEAKMNGGLMGEAQKKILNKFYGVTEEVEDAIVFASMPDLSMDTKMLLIFRSDL